MRTPKNLSDLRFQEYTAEIDGNYTEAVEYATRWFKEAGMDTAQLTVNSLFSEDDAIVFECYVDSGSVDYLYIIAK